MNQPASTASPSPGKSPRARRRRWPWWVAAVIALPVVLVAAALVWTNSAGSLRQSLSLAQRFLPADQQLEFADATGSITRGGHLARLTWSAPGITLTIEDFQLDWQLSQLLQDELQVDTLRAARVHVRLTPRTPQPPTEPFVMPRELVLPFRATVPLQVGRIEIESVDAEGAGSTQVIENLRADYRYDDVHHALRLESLAYGQSRMQASMRLHARSLALEAQLAASLRDLAPQMPLAMLAHAQASGTLAGGDEARLELALDAREQDRDAQGPQAEALLEQLATLRTTLEEAGAPGSSLAQLHARAAVFPWRAQPVESLQLRTTRLNAAAFHASAPATLLEGEATVTPVEGAAETWDFILGLRNGIAGPWDAQRLPLREVESSAQLTPEGLAIRSARLTLPGDPAGTVELAGNLPRAGLSQARLQLQLQRVDLRQLMASLPATGFVGALTLQPLPPAAAGAGAGAAEGWQAEADFSNARAGRLDQERLPLTRLVGTAQVTPDRWQAEALQLTVGEGSLRMSGQFTPESGSLDVRGDLRRLPLAAIHEKLATSMAPELSGSLTVAGDVGRQLTFEADVASNAAAASQDQWAIRTVQLQGDWSPSRLRIARIDLDALQARIEGNGIDVALPDLSAITAHVSASAPGLALQADAEMRDRSGGGTLSLRLDSAAQTLQWLRELPLIGEQLPAMQATGAAHLDARWQGGWRQWIDGLSNPERYPQLSIDATLASDSLHVELPEGATPAMLDVSALDASLQGNLAAAAFVLGGSIRADDSAATLDVRVQMQRDAEDASTPGWQFLFERMLVDATLPGEQQPWSLALGDGLQVNLDTGATLQLDTTAGQLSLTPPARFAAGGGPLQIAWEPLQLRRNAQGATRLQSRGTIQGIQPGWLDGLQDRFGAGRLQAAGFGTDLVLGAEWDLSLDEALDVRARVQRESGDLWLLGAQLGDAQAGAQPEVGRTAGIRAIDLTIESHDEQLALAMNWDTERAGIITAEATTSLTPSGGGWSLPEQAALDGRIEARLQDLAMWGIFAPPGWRIQGEVNADLTLAGTVQTPLLSGAVSGRGLNVRSVLDGVELHDGVLRAALDGQRLTIEELVFQGGTGSRAYISGLSGNRTPAPSARGSMTVAGVVDWSGMDDAAPGQTGIAMDFNAALERMQVLVRNDRQLTVSGELAAALQEGTLRVRGNLNVDRATVLLPDAGAPTLGDDVIVVRNDDPLEMIEVGAAGAETGRLESARPMDVEIELNLGRDLALHGYGITTRLEGELTLRSSTIPERPFSLFGEVRTNEGRYRAWGQALNVETGEVAFNGSYENPSLNLLAIRPEIAVRAGVRVTGTLQAPQVELYSDPPLPEAEKLSWVVLGRATAIGGGEGTSVQRAALSLLAGRAVGSLADDLGVDELGLGDSAVSVGKRISDQLYLTYEAGLSGAASTLYIFYDITRRFTIRGESGEANAVDLIYSFDFD